MHPAAAEVVAADTVMEGGEAGAEATLGEEIHARFRSCSYRPEVKHGPDIGKARKRLARSVSEGDDPFDFAIGSGGPAAFKFNQMAYPRTEADIAFVDRVPRQRS